VNHLGDLLSALIDGELTGTDLDRANAHLAACAQCQTEAAELRQLKRALRALAETAGADVYGAALSERLLALDGPAHPGRPGHPRPNYLARARRVSRVPRRRAARRRTRLIWSAVSLMVVGIGTAAFAVGGGGSGPGERQITPQFEVFDVHNAMTTGEVPFNGPADVTAEPAQPPETPEP
jgi:anti-sigma factor RsiW